MHPEVAAVDGVPDVEVVLPEGLVHVLELLVRRPGDPQTRPPETSHLTLSLTRPRINININ